MTSNPNSPNAYPQRPFKMVSFPTINNPIPSTSGPKPDQIAIIEPTIAPVRVDDDKASAILETLFSQTNFKQTVDLTIQLE
jgi:hypothetical protein